MYHALRLRLPLALLAGLAAAGSLASCGGGGSSPGASDVNSLLAQTFGPKQSVHSGQLATSIDLNLQGTKTLSGPISIKLDGPFQGHGPKIVPEFKLNLLIGSAAQSFTAGVTTTAGKAWVHFAGADYLVPDSLYSQFRDSYLKGQSSSGGTSNLAKFGIDPRHWLTGARNVGHAQIAGTDTIHITAGIDVAKLLADFNTLLGKTSAANVPNAPKGISPATQAALSRATKTASVDIYTGAADHSLRRLTLALQLSVPQGQQSALRGLKGGAIGFDLQLSQLNKSQQISAPANAKPLSGLLSGITGGSGASATGPQGGAGSGSGARSSTPAPASGAAAPNVSAPKAYLDCVKQAGSNVPAIQKCQSLISAGN
ncbi:MAG: hypothetical protein ACR2ND_00800 [Solirubrobacteraceae bacterium]